MPQGIPLHQHQHQLAVSEQGEGVGVLQHHELVQRGLRSKAGIVDRLQLRHAGKRQAGLAWLRLGTADNTLIIGDQDLMES